MRSTTLILIAAFFGLAAVSAEDKKPAYPKPRSAENVQVIPDEWQAAPDKAITAAELDQLLSKELRAEQLRPAPLTTDEQFIRRVTLDLTGKLPRSTDVEEFVRTRDSKKRSKLVDKLLASEDFCRHWARYWRDVIAARATDPRYVRLGGAFEEWLFQQFKLGRDWQEIARDMITAKGELRLGEPADMAKNAAGFFLLMHVGAEADNERAAETSRVFLGIQIQCAQCHDHPNDIWKRRQFHELAAFYARTRDRRIQRDGKPGGVELVSLPRGEHRMPDMDDPKKATTINPRFLTGQAISAGRSDQERRQALADFVTSPDNYWFAAAYVNRIWGELMGQAFYQPVDNMGPLQEATYPHLLLRLGASFRATNYDIKALFRTVANSQAYQRQIRLGDSLDYHLHFSAAYPTRLRADTLWQALGTALGMTDAGQRRGPGREQGPKAPLGQRGGVAGMFKQVFDFDPSTKSDEVEGSVPQALMLMNNPALNGRIKATGDTPLARILRSHDEDDAAIKAVYLQTLARKPTARELKNCKDYIKQLGPRGEAFEDIQWSLINSTEFQTKR